MALNIWWYLWCVLSIYLYIYLSLFILPLFFLGTSVFLSFCSSDPLFFFSSVHLSLHLLYIPVHWYLTSFTLPVSFLFHVSSNDFPVLIVYLFFYHFWLFAISELVFGLCLFLPKQSLFIPLVSSYSIYVVENCALCESSFIIRILVHCSKRVLHHNPVVYVVKWWAKKFSGW